MRLYTNVQISGQRRLKSKWSKTRLLQGEGALQKHIPTTKIMSKETLYAMLTSAGMVYVKPSIGSFGKGVMKVERIHSHFKRSHISYAYQLGANRQVFQEFDEMYQALKKEMRGKKYIVQKGIHSLKHQGNLFDFRVVVQRSPKGEWEMTGIVGRIAQRGKIVSNGSQGGTLLPAHQLLQGYAGGGGYSRIIRQLEQISLRTIRRMHKANPKIKELGLDIALDRELRPWILEVNLRPDHCLFAVLQDQSMIRKIIQYGAAYGRRYKLNCY